MVVLETYSVFSELILAILSHPSILRGSIGDALGTLVICTGDTGGVLNIFGVHTRNTESSQIFSRNSWRYIQYFLGYIVMILV